MASGLLNWSAEELGVRLEDWIWKREGKDGETYAGTLLVSLDRMNNFYYI